MLDKLKVKRLLEDPALYLSLLPILACIFPAGAEWFEDNKEAFAGLIVVLSLHFGVRIAGTMGAGRAIATGAVTHSLPAAEVEPGIVLNPDDLDEAELLEMLAEVRAEAPREEAEVENA